MATLHSVSRSNKRLCHTLEISLTRIREITLEITQRFHARSQEKQLLIKLAWSLNSSRVSHALSRDHSRGHSRGLSRGLPRGLSRDLSDVVSHYSLSLIFWWLFHLSSQDICRRDHSALLLVSQFTFPHVKSPLQHPNHFHLLLQIFGMLCQTIFHPFQLFLLLEELSNITYSSSLTLTVVLFDLVRSNQLIVSHFVMQRLLLLLRRPETPCRPSKWRSIRAPTISWGDNFP